MCKFVKFYRSYSVNVPYFWYFISIWSSILVQMAKMINWVGIYVLLAEMMQKIHKTNDFKALNRIPQNHGLPPSFFSKKSGKRDFSCDVQYKSGTFVRTVDQNVSILFVNFYVWYCLVWSLMLVYECTQTFFSILVCRLIYSVPGRIKHRTEANTLQIEITWPNIDNTYS